MNDVYLSHVPHRLERKGVSLTTVFLLCGLGLLLGSIGCAPSQKHALPEPVYTPAEESLPKGENPGSLFDPGQADYLFADSRARRVGDIVTINIVENTVSKNKASTDANKESSLDLGVQNFMGDGYLKGIPVGTTPAIKAGSSSNFSGDGETKRENYLTTTVSVRVVRVLANGVLEVEGGREVRINDETQIVVVRGIIRSRDIGPDNSILSTAMADARIELYGKGVLADKQKPGWLTRILDNVWPF
ncbi:flagellar basal body L-ring protein FlgH [Desulfoplanes sp.]